MRDSVLSILIPQKSLKKNLIISSSINGIKKDEVNRSCGGKRNKNLKKEPSDVLRRKMF